MSILDRVQDRKNRNIAAMIAKEKKDAFEKEKKDAFEKKKWTIFTGGSKKYSRKRGYRKIRDNYTNIVKSTIKKVNR